MEFDFYIGVFFLVVGIVFLIGRIFKIEKMFGKLEKMKEFWGPTRGSIIHFIVYVILPIVVGIIFIVTSL